MRAWLGDEPTWVVMTEDKEVFEKAKSLFPEALILLCHHYDEEEGDWRPLATVPARTY